MQVKKGMCGCDTGNILNLVQLEFLWEEQHIRHTVGETQIIVHLD